VTLGEALSGRDNALNFVRLLLAALVIVSHSWPAAGLGPNPQFGDLNLGAWAVAGFFGISGYLITASRNRLSLKDFAAARCLRIYPAYWVALLAVALVFAPLAALITGTPVVLGAGLHYVVVNLTTWQNEWVFGEAMTQSAWPTQWNSPLWTLALEMGCYVLVGLVFSLRWVRARPGLVAVALLLSVTGFNCLLTAAGVGRGLMLLDFLRLLAFFAAGVLLWAFRDRVPVDWRLAAAASGAFVVIAAVRHTDDVGALPAAYLVLFAGAVLPVRWGQRTDLSYGLYVFGWPIQIVMGLAGAKILGPYLFAAVAFSIAAGAAALSWHFVEEPALRLRPGRRPSPSVSAADAQHSRHPTGVGA
jgi:peptidoglycan/LPS O-acetylase OafA/YrhL